MEILNHCGNSLKAIFLCTIDPNALFMFLLGSVESLVHLATVTRLADSILYCDNAEREIRVLSSSSWVTVLCFLCMTYALLVTKRGKKVQEYKKAASHGAEGCGMEGGKK